VYNRPGREARGITLRFSFGTASTPAPVVERYKDRVRHWQLWHEPDNPMFWQREDQMQKYTQLLRLFIAAEEDGSQLASFIWAGCRGRCRLIERSV